jgi:hypothetical protein
VQLPDVLTALGIEQVRTSMQVTSGTAYAVETGQAGRLTFERALTTEVIPDRETRSTWIQAYAVPAFAITKPGAVRKITGLAG